MTGSRGHNVLTVESVLRLELHGLGQLHHVENESLTPRQEVGLGMSRNVISSFKKKDKKR
jgi:hypothetical protein